MSDTYQFATVVSTDKKLKELNKAKKLSSNLSTRFDTEITGQYQVLCGGHSIYLDEKNGRLLAKELTSVFRENENEKENS